VLDPALYSHSLCGLFRLFDYEGIAKRWQRRSLPICLAGSMGFEEGKRGRILPG
jgi:hypothetical protein